MSVVKTGIEGLDSIVRGGLPEGCVYLIEGTPGSGKTTLSLQFLLEGVRAGERVLYITLSESKSEIETTAESHGLALTNVDIFEFLPNEHALSEEEQYTVFDPSDVELNQVTKLLLEAVERVKPRRVVFDSLSELRLLSKSSARYRRQILALKQALSGRNCTVFFLDDCTGESGNLQLHSIVHGVVSLNKHSPKYGTTQRQLEISKLRGVNFSGGYHDFAIERGGLKVFPRLVASHHVGDYDTGTVKSGLPGLDQLLGGGLERGTSVLLLGPIGSGKSIVSSCFADAAAARGERSAIFTFDESADTLFARARGLGMQIERYVKEGVISVRQIDPAEVSPGEFAYFVRQAVEESGARIVVIDSLAGYLASMPESKLLTAQMHELLAYLNHRGVLTILVMTQHGLLGSALESPVDISYLADSVILLRYFEAVGEIKKAVSVIKKRTGPHELAIREFHLAPNKISIGAAIKNFQGVLQGVPVFVGDRLELFEKHDGSAKP